ncbi:KAP family P-loop NTPase fold protein [Homoserinimonas sp. A447]
MAAAEHTPDRPPVDNPIESSEQDALGRAPLARDFARSLRLLDASHGLVVGVFGPWGHGKSSFINLMREEFASEPPLVVIDFNPWMFSGTQQLVDHFFDELASNFKRMKDPNLQVIAGYIDDYGDSIGTLAGLFGTWASLGSILFRSGAKALARKRGAGAKFQRASAELAQLAHPVVVVIDDIDRLTSEEIRDVFKLVRLTASFPNVIYVLAFDRKRVEAALAEPGIEGRAYLEKIIQVSFDLPGTPTEVLTSQVFSALQNVIDAIEGEARFASDRWPDVYFEVIAPLIRNMRDITRYAVSAAPTLGALGSEIEVVDLLALEAIRVFRPEIFATLGGMQDALTKTSSAFASTKSPALQAKMDDLLAVSGADAHVVRALVAQVFPAARQYYENNNYGSDWDAVWRKGHRLAHSDYLGMYLERTAPSGLRAFRIAEQLVAAMVEQDRFESILDGIATSDFPDILEAFGSLRGQFEEPAIAPSISALMNRIDHVPESRVGGLLTLAPHIVVLRPVLRMLEQVSDVGRRDDIVQEATRHLNSYSSRLELITSTGKRQRGPNLISEALATALEARFVEDFRAGESLHVEREWNLADVFHYIGEQLGQPAQLANERNPDVTRAVLRTAQGRTTSQSVGSRHVDVKTIYQWDGLVRLYGTEDGIRDAVAALKEVDGSTALVLLAERYLSGWRPGGDD